MATVKTLTEIDRMSSDLYMISIKVSEGIHHPLGLILRVDDDKFKIYKSWIGPQDSTEYVSLEVAAESLHEGYKISVSEKDLSSSWDDKRVVNWTNCLPKTCDICSNDLVDTFVDGVTKFGAWASMCESCHHDQGLGFGTGRGQLYSLDDGNKIKG